MTLTRAHDVSVSEALKTSFTLVHGTFKRKAPWTRHGSPLRQALKQTLMSPTRIYPFVWSGSYSSAERQKAAERLANKLVRRVQQQPTALHFVIAHSHGGNIALKAMQIGQLGEKVHLICLSTPFIHVQPRHIDLQTKANIGIGAAIDLALFLVVSIKFAAPSFEHVNWILCGVATVLGAISALIYDSERKAVHDIAAQLSHIAPPSTRLCIIRTAGDEASAFIGGLHCISWVFTVMLDRIGRLHRFFEELTENRSIGKIRVSRNDRRVLVYAGLSIISWIAALLSRDLSKLLSTAFSLVAFVGIVLISGYLLAALVRSQIKITMSVIALALYIILLTIFAPLAAGIALCALVFGGRSIVLGFLYQITAEATPDGLWQVHQISPEMSTSLNHSATTADPAATFALSEWIKARIEATGDVKM